ncbi:hypothetical protein LINPERPRIM_LOCUS33322, partial [Linum perenne]
PTHTICRSLIFLITPIFFSRLISRNYNHLLFTKTMFNILIFLITINHVRPSADHRPKPSDILGRSFMKSLFDRFTFGSLNQNWSRYRRNLSLRAVLFHLVFSLSLIKIPYQFQRAPLDWRVAEQIETSNLSTRSLKEGVHPWIEALE